MENQIDAKILDRLKKIMKLQEGATTQGEAEAAAAAAQRLIIQYNLDISTIDLSDKVEDKANIEEVKLPYKDKRTGGEWRLNLMYAIADNNFCSVLYWRGIQNMVLIGTRANIEMVTYLYNSLAERLFQIAKEEYKTYKIDKLAYMVTHLIEKPISYDAFYRRFLNGAAYGVRKKLQDGLKKLKEENTSLTGLMVYNEKALLDYKKEKYNPRMRNRETKVDEVFVKGVETGEKIDIHKGIRETKPNATHIRQLKG